MSWTRRDISPRRLLYLNYQRVERVYKLDSAIRLSRLRDAPPRLVVKQRARRKPRYAYPFDLHFGFHQTGAPNSRIVMASRYSLERLSIASCRPVGRAAVGGLLAFAVAVSFFGGVPSFASQPVDTIRDLPLPKRWRAQYIEDPVFNTHTYVVEAGRPNGPQVLLVHGLGQSGYQDWWEVIHDLETEYRVVALDLPGFARSGMPAGELSPARYARFLNWLIHRLDLTEVNLVGHSLGGAIALYLAGEHPARIANVVLVDAAGVLQRVAFLREVTEDWAQAHDVPDVFTEYKKRLFNWGGRLAEQFMIQSPLDVTRILRHSNRRWNAKLSDEPNINAAVSLLETDFSGVLSRFNRPATIIWGDNDGVTPLRVAYLLNGSLRTSALHTIDGAGHVPMKTHTREFMSRLRYALSHPPGPGKSGLPDGPSQGNLVCRDQPGSTVSGVFDRIVVDRCPGMRFVNVSARHMTVSGSSQVHFRNVTINSETTALDINQSNVTATNIWVSGSPAVRVDKSRLDVAGGTFNAQGSAIHVVRRSTVIFSVSHVDSSVRKGSLHGAVIISDSVLDGTSKLQ